MSIQKRLEERANDLRIALVKGTGRSLLVHREYVERLVELLDEAALEPVEAIYADAHDDLQDELVEAEDEIERLTFALQTVRDLVHPSKAGGVGDAIRRVVEEALGGATKKTIEEVAKVEGASA